MDSLELIVFDVGHGLSVALIERPENYVCFVDLGTEEDFAPLRYLAKVLHLRPDVLYVTHPHADHIAGIEDVFDRSCRPDLIYCQDFNWNDVANREQRQFRPRVKRLEDALQAIPRGFYCGNAKLTPWRYKPEGALELFGENRYVNASSLFLVYRWKAFKIAIASDHESDVIDGFLRSAEFVKDVTGAQILVAPHHGHKNGFPTNWVARVGRPCVTLISVQERDPHVDTRYSKPEFASGIHLDGRDRYSLTTREVGSIHVRMWYEGNRLVWEFKTL